MAVTNTSICHTFIHEFKWAKEVIAQLNDYKSKSWAIGLNGDTGRPDGFLVGFATRGLPFVTYIRGAGLSIGDEGAYDQNIATVRAYIDTAREAEVKAISDLIAAIEDYKTRSWAFGLTWPDGQPDTFTQAFAVRHLNIHWYLRGNISAGDDTAYERSVKTLRGYLQTLSEHVLE